MDRAGKCSSGNESKGRWGLYRAGGLVPLRCAETPDKLVLEGGMGDSCYLWSGDDQTGAELSPLAER